MASPILRFFQFSHLEDQTTRNISAECAKLAHTMEANLSDGPEKSAGLRKLLEAKDCFVRATLPE